MPTITRNLGSWSVSQAVKVDGATWYRRTLRLTVALQGEVKRICVDRGVSRFSAEFLPTTEPVDPDLPTSPTIALALAGEPDAAYLFYTYLGEGNSPTPKTTDPNPLADALENVVSRLLEANSADSLDLDLVFQSNKPCRIQLHDLHIIYSQQITVRLNGELEKVTLPFSADRPTSHSVQLNAPIAPTYINAQLELSIKRSAALATRSNSGTPALLAGDLKTHKMGMQVSADHPRSQPFTLTTAQHMHGVGLALIAMREETELIVRLTADYKGKPAGKPLAEATVTLNDVGRPTWGIAKFAKPLLLSTDKHWLTLSATNGRAVWLGNVGDLYYQWLAVERSSGGVGGSGSAETLALRLNGETLPLTIVDDKTALCDLTTALNNGSVAAPLTLTVSAFGLQSVTLYPPRFEA